ncbi:MAG: hypothetical protein WKF81_12045 [Thermomicrobiales bacterium]
MTDQTMPDFPLRLWKQTQATLLMVRMPTVWIPLAVGLASLIASLLIVPGTEPSFWNWIGLPIVATLGGLSVLADMSRRYPRTTAVERRDLLIVAVVALVCATIISLFTTLLGTAIFVLALCLIAAMAIRSRSRQRIPVVLAGAVALLIPIWIWFALDSQTSGLLLLVPLGLLAWFADTYMKAALQTDTRESTSGARSYRFLSWLALLAATIMTTLLAISSDVSNSWAVIGALGAVILIGADAGLPQHSSLPGSWSRQIMALGFAWLTLFWLTSL